MKKLLFVLICLFVSFEVKSESDDLSGKKLLCEGKYEGYQRTIGINFIDNYAIRIITVHYNDSLNNPLNEPWLSDFDGHYTTTLRKIKIHELNFLKYNIDRVTLNDGENFLCKITNVNLEKTLKEKFIKVKKKREQNIIKIKKQRKI